MEPAWRELRLTVQIATKLNRSHLVHGEAAYLLPCLGRTEMTGRQAARSPCRSRTAQPASTARVGRRRRPAHSAVRAGDHRRHRQGYAGPPNPNVDWDGWVADYYACPRCDRRDLSGIFHDFNAAHVEAGRLSSRNSRRANGIGRRRRQGELHHPDFCATDLDATGEPRRLRLMTLRSNDQFNTTDLRLRRPFPRHPRHADGGADAPQRHSDASGL